MNFRLLVCVSLLLAPCISGSLSPATLQSSLSSLISPNLCQLKLICAISQSDSQLRESVFMRGISTLADLTAGTFLGNLTTDAFLLQYSIEAGQTGRPCSLVAPQCPYSERELLTATEELGITRDQGDNHVTEIRRRWRRQTRGQESYYDYSNYYEQDNYYNDQNKHYSYSQQRDGGSYQRAPGTHPRPGQSLRRPRPSPNRRQGVLGSMPPIFRPRDAMAREVCRGCDMRGNVCSVYGIGSFIGCTGILLIGGAPAQVACNMVTTPGSIGCGINTLSCFMESCGLIRMTLP